METGGKTRQDGGIRIKGIRNKATKKVKAQEQEQEQEQATKKKQEIKNIQYRITNFQV